MAGNVWEWVDGSYLGYPGNNYELADTFNDYFKVVRGGSWDNSAQHLRTTFRMNNEPRLRSDGTGFRCAADADAFESSAGIEVAEPTLEVTIEPTVELTIEPTAETTIEPTSEPTAEIVPTIEPTSELPLESTVEPTVEPTIEPTDALETGG